MSLQFRLLNGIFEACDELEAPTAADQQCHLETLRIYFGRTTIHDECDCAMVELNGGVATSPKLFFDVDGKLCIIEMNHSTYSGLVRDGNWEPRAVFGAEDEPMMIYLAKQRPNQPRATTVEYAYTYMFDFVSGNIIDIEILSSGISLADSSLSERN